MDDHMRTICTSEELKIFSDPYRMSIISAYQSAGKPLTVKQVADILGEVPAKVHYHVKKLLSIDILALDHIEVINGINAKYYFLPKTSFKINLREEDNTMDLDRLDHITRFIVKTVDSFKDDLITHSEKVKDNKKEHGEEGMLTKKDLYLTDEEYKEVNETILKITDKYCIIDNTKTKYSFLGGIIRKID